MPHTSIYNNIIPNTYYKVSRSVLFSSVLLLNLALGNRNAL
jgi:hypothetical protein